jgi:hypothetical protein
MSISSLVRRDISWPVPPEDISMSLKYSSQGSELEVLGHSTRVNVSFWSASWNCSSGVEKCSRTASLVKKFDSLVESALTVANPERHYEDKLSNHFYWPLFIDLISGRGPARPRFPLPDSYLAPKYFHLKGRTRDARNGSLSSRFHGFGTCPVLRCAQGIADI